MNSNVQNCTLEVLHWASEAQNRTSKVQNGTSEFQNSTSEVQTEISELEKCRFRGSILNFRVSKFVLQNFKIQLYIFKLEPKSIKLNFNADPLKPQPISTNLQTKRHFLTSVKYFLIPKITLIQNNNKIKHGHTKGNLTSSCPYKKNFALSSSIL